MVLCRTISRATHLDSTSGLLDGGTLLTAGSLGEVQFHLLHVTTSDTLPLVLLLDIDALASVPVSFLDEV